MAWRERIIKLLRGAVNGIEKASNAGVRGARRGIDSLEERQGAKAAAGSSPDGDVSGESSPPVA
jgi:hypothetical protein